MTNHCLVVRVNCGYSFDEVTKSWENAKDKAEGIPDKLKLDITTGSLSLEERKGNKIEYTSALALLLVLSDILKQKGSGFINYRWFDEIYRLEGLQVASSSYS